MAVERLAASGDARKQKALSDYAVGEEDRAISDLTRLAEDQTKAAQDNVQQAANTWKEVGALAFQSNTDKALDAYKMVVQLAPDDFVARNQLGLLLIRIGELDGAKAQYEYVLQKSGFVDRDWRATALNHLGIISQIRGNLDLAKDYHKRGLALSEQLGFKTNIAAQLNNLGLIEYTRGNLDLAEDY